MIDCMKRDLPSFEDLFIVKQPTYHQKDPTRRSNTSKIHFLKTKEKSKELNIVLSANQPSVRYDYEQKYAFWMVSKTYSRMK